MFYLKPPRGTIHREKILDLVSKRLKILRDASAAEDYSDLLATHLEECESVREGSAKDRVSHYSLLLAAAAQRGGGDLLRHVVAWETRLFGLRARDMEAGGLEEALEELRRHLRERLQLARLDQGLVEILRAVSEILENRLLRAKADEGVHVLVPFFLASSLVRSRQVHLRSGKAILTSDNVRKFLEDVFKTLVEHSVEQAVPHDDQDVAEFADAVLKIYEKDFEVTLPSSSSSSSCTSSSRVLKACQVEFASEGFPPCMRYLQRRLFASNRLRHGARVAYTLFLKDVGVSSEESVAFWSGHYSKEAGPGSGCGHSWARNRRRYEYSIHHLYGRRGSRTDYSSHSCESIGRWSSSSPTEQLFCPFRALSGPELEDHFSTRLGQSLDKEAAALAAQGRWREACACITVQNSSRSNEDLTKYTKPSHFVNIPHY